MRTACYANDWRYGGVGKEFEEGRAVGGLSVFGRVKFFGSFLLRYFGGTAKCPDASEVGVAFSHKVWELNAFEHRNAIVDWVVIVPLVALAVHEYHEVWEVMVMIDYVSNKSNVSPASCRNSFTHVK